MKLFNALSDKQMDTRVIDRLMAEGKVTKAEYDAHLANLPDEEGNYEVVDAAEQASTEEAPLA